MTSGNEEQFEDHQVFATTVTCGWVGVCVCVRPRSSVHAPYTKRSHHSPAELGEPHSTAQNQVSGTPNTCPICNVTL